MLQSGVAVEKIPFREIRKNKIASGCPTNDSLSFLDILYPQNFDRLGGNWIFSTPTRYFNSYRHLPHRKGGGGSSQRS